jgi:hypothetical protein
MAEKGLTLKVLFKAIDEMSGTLKAIGIGFDNADKFAKQAAQSAKAFAAIGALGLAGNAAGGKLLEQTSAAAQAAAPLDEAITRLKQIAPAIDSGRAAKDAFNLVTQYGVASIDEEVGALTRAVQLYGDYDKAVAATADANRMALATHQPVIDALNQTGAVARTSGQSIDAVTDKLTAMWKAAGGAGNLAQVERAWGMAKEHGETLEHFLAVMAEAQKAGISGRSLSTYYEETAGKKGAAGHYSQSTAAIHALLDKQSADIATIEAQIRKSEGVTKSLAATQAESPVQKAAREQRIGEAEQAAAGAELLKQKGYIDDWVASLKTWETEYALLHPKQVAAVEDLKVASGETATWGGRLLGLVGSLSLLNKVFPTFTASIEALLKAAGGAAEGGAAAAAPVLAPAAAVIAAGYLAGPSPRETAFRARVAATFPAGLTAPVFHAPPMAKPAATTPTTINVTNSPTINIAPSSGGDATPAKTAEAVKAALDSHDRELEIKLKTAVDRATTAAERSSF